MANLFDFFIERNKQKAAAAAALTGDPAVGSQSLGPAPVRPAAGRDVAAMINQPPVDAPMARPVLTPPPATAAIVSPTGLTLPDAPVSTDLGPAPPPPRTELQGLYDKRQAQENYVDKLKDFKNNPVINQDHGFKGRLGDILEQALISAGQSYDKASGTGWERVGSGLGGALAGGIYGGVHPQVDEERRRLQAITKAQGEANSTSSDIDRTLKEQYSTARTADVLAKPEDRKLAIEQRNAAQQAISERQMRAFDNRMAIHAQDADVKAGIATTYTDKDGKVWKKFLHADSKGQMRPSEPLVNPGTGEQEFDPGEQQVEVVDPVTQKRTLVKAKTAYGVDSNASAAAGRLGETVRHNTVTEGQTAARDAAISTARTAMLDMHQQELDMRKAGQPDKADAMALKQKQFKATMLTRQNEGKLTQADIDAIFSDFPSEVGVGEPTQ